MKENSSANNNLKDLLMFILGGFGVPFFNWLQTIIPTMNSWGFAIVCMLIAYYIISSILKKIP